MNNITDLIELLETTINKSIQVKTTSAQQTRDNYTEVRSAFAITDRMIATAMSEMRVYLGIKGKFQRLYDSIFDRETFNKNIREEFEANKLNMLAMIMNAALESAQTIPNDKEYFQRDGKVFRVMPMAKTANDMRFMIVAKQFETK